MKCTLLAGCLAWICTLGAAAPAEPFTPDPFAGDYAGTWSTVGRPEATAHAKVIAQGQELYRFLITATPEDADPLQVELYGKVKGGQIAIDSHARQVHWTGWCTGEEVLASIDHHYGGVFRLQRAPRPSPTLGAEPPADARVLLPWNGGAPLTAEQREQVAETWTNPDWKLHEDGTFEVTKAENRTKQQFTNVRVHIEFCLPNEPHNRGQGRANSGVFLCHGYEVQILDSYGLIPGAGDCGAIYNQAVPRINACLPPTAWQTYDIEFTAPVMANGSVERLPRISVRHNGKLIHEDFEMSHPTLGPNAKHVPRGPLWMQDHGHPVRFRNIWIVELDK